MATYLHAIEVIPRIFPIHVEHMGAWVSGAPSASYNNGARKFLKEFEKPNSVTKWQRFRLKFQYVRRITRTLDKAIRVCWEPSSK